MTLDEYKSMVVKEAVKIVTGQKWWRGKVCTDTVESSYLDNKSVEEAAKTVADDTFFWDAT